MPRAFLRFGQILLVVSMLGICGAQWLVLQTFAWSKMLADYAHDSGWTEAVQKTFDGKHPCALCQSIAREKKSEQKTNVTIVVTKLTLYHQPGAPWVMREGLKWNLEMRDSAGELRFERPALPPPRVA